MTWLRHRNVLGATSGVKAATTREPRVTRKASMADTTSMDKANGGSNLVGPGSLLTRVARPTIRGLSARVSTGPLKSLWRYPTLD